MLEIAKPLDVNWQSLLPLELLGGLFVLVFLLEVLRRPGSRTTAGFWTLLVSVVGLAVLIFPPEPVSGAAVVHQMWKLDGLTRLGSVLVFASLAMVSLVVPREIRESEHLGEYFALLVGAALGMVMLLGSNNLLISFLALELFSLALYLLCIFFPDKAACQESGLKYFILSSLASALMLYGMALIYGSTGSTWLHEIADKIDQGGLALIIGSAMLAAGFAFKASAVPFHLWTPDVYQGAPSPVTAFMSVATKVAAIGALVRFFPLTLGVSSGGQDLARLDWCALIWSLAILSMLFGNLMALSQTNLKRLLAYSGIAQAGYLLAAVSVGTPEALTSLGYYLLVYLFMNTGAFLVVVCLEELGEELTLASLAGLSLRRPWLAASLAVCLLSLAGLPPTSGFFAKVSLFVSLLNAPWGMPARYLVAAGLVGSLLSVGYYLKVVVACYSPGPAPEPRQELPAPFGLVVGICVVGVFGLAWWAAPVFAWVQSLLTLG